MREYKKIIVNYFPNADKKNNMDKVRIVASSLSLHVEDCNFVGNVWLSKWTIYLLVY